ncbi:hypothetical protein KCMC57_up58010 [Kitasatospora sp. CMC57]|uniref:Uncharacterized protein n=1 Tax=Kitasatospora sp. CMC57 TaxID=3231513 RepID=A0AB33KDC9_9ACTN
MTLTSTFRAARRLTTAIGAAAILAACAGTADGSFDAQAATPSPSCLQHQKETPGTRYTGGEKSDPTAVLEMMRYYTSNSHQPYCDAKPDTDTDRAWHQLYTRLGGDPSRFPGA